MKILIIGEQENFEELKLKLGKEHEYELMSSWDFKAGDLNTVDIVFDFLIDEGPEMVQSYGNAQCPIFLNTVKVTLSEINYLYGLPLKCFGFNGLKSFVNRPHLELVCKNGDEQQLKQIMESLEVDYKLVKDRVGMVTPRVVLMIINEAFYTVQEGTASKSDIDLGMKLGTNYPYGPFEWANMIGIKDIYETLEALYEDTKEERYKICPSLKSEYLNAV